MVLHGGIVLLDDFVASFVVVFVSVVPLVVVGISDEVMVVEDVVDCDVVVVTVVEVAFVDVVMDLFCGVTASPTEISSNSALTTVATPTPAFAGGNAFSSPVLQLSSSGWMV